MATLFEGIAHFLGEFWGTPKRQIPTRGAIPFDTSRLKIPHGPAPELGVLVLPCDPSAAYAKRLVNARHAANPHEACVALSYTDPVGQVLLDLYRAAAPQRLLWTGYVGSLAPDNREPREKVIGDVAIEALDPARWGRIKVEAIHT